MKLFGRGFFGLGLLLACILLAGCKSGGKGADKNGPYSFDPLNDNTTGAMDASSGLPGSGSSATGPGSGSDTNLVRAILQPGDTIVVGFNDLVSAPPAIEEQIKEDGSITLNFGERFHAAGKSVRELQAEIHDRYVPKYYKYMTPSVKPSDRFFSIGGEIHQPNRYVWTAGMTVLRAIDAAGGFTDFSRKGKVVITRASGKQEFEDCVSALKHPEKDLPIYPGDQLFVRKRIW